MTSWYRGGNTPAERPVWLARSREYASFYGKPVLACAVRANVLDLTALGVDYNKPALVEAGVDQGAASRAPGSGEMYEWAEKNARKLQEHGVEAVAVMQWHADYSTEPEETVLVFDSKNVECLEAPQRRRIVEAPTRSRPALQSIRVIVEEDPDPDVSYLDQDEFEDRKSDYKRGKFNFVGARVDAEVVIADTVQTLTSPGLYGIESDSEQEYLDEIIREEWSQLRDVLKAVGVPTEQLPLEVQREWIET